MAELELTRSREDRRLYVLDGLGSLRLEGLMSRRATATAAGATWRIGRAGFWGRGVQAFGSANTLVGEFDPRAIRRGGELRWNGRLLELRPASPSRERYALAVAGWPRTPHPQRAVRASRQPVPAPVDIASLHSGPC
jgi:hypothetical protein